MLYDLDEFKTFQFITLIKEITIYLLMRTFWVIQLAVHAIKITRYFTEFYWDFSCFRFYIYTHH
jgi:hypothetical protein